MDGGRGMVGGAGVGAERDRERVEHIDGRGELRGDSLLSGTGGDASRLGHLYTISLLSSTSGTLAQLTADSCLLAGGGAGDGADAAVSQLRWCPRWQRCSTPVTSSRPPMSTPSLSSRISAARLSAPAMNELLGTPRRARGVVAAAIGDGGKDSHDVAGEKCTVASGNPNRTFSLLPFILHILFASSVGDGWMMQQYRPYV
jgi:hypothetical protein